MRIPLLLLGILFSACSCNSIPKEPTRTTVEQINAVVKISVMCGENRGGGSGVIVSEGKILTAYHVVECDGGVEPLVTIDPGDGIPRDAAVEIILPGRDIARLQLDVPTLDDFMTKVAIGPRPKVGDEVCIGTAIPRFSYHCGRVQPGDTGMIYWDHMTEFGNSGSGAYHNGKLIGLLDVLKYCQSGVPCVGGITPLQGYEWLVP